MWDIAKVETYFFSICAGRAGQVRRDGGPSFQALTRFLIRPAFVLRALVVTLGCAALTGCQGAAEKSATPRDAGDAARSSGDASPDTSISAGDTARPPVEEDDASRPGDAPAFDSEGGAEAAMAPDPSGGPGPSVTLNPFADVYLFGDHNGQSQRSFDVTVDFPVMPLTYRTITLKIALRCPTAVALSCDYVDQRGFVGVVRQVGDVETVYEIQRFITPYGSPATFTTDVTSIRPLLSGTVALRLWVDTWAHPGSNMGEGWRVDVSFEFTGGVPTRLPVAVLPLWGETIFDYGDPVTPQPYIPAQQVTVPSGARAVEIRSFITGHGQGNSENCGEFCPKTHTFTIGGQPFTRSIWRTDCASTASRNQTSGAYVYPRAGWCPGATVLPWVADVTAAAPAGQATQVSYSVQPYTNTCQPSTCMLMSCAFYGTTFFNGSCEYDQQLHAVPYYVISSLLVVYGD